MLFLGGYLCNKSNSSELINVLFFLPSFPTKYNTFFLIGLKTPRGGEKDRFVSDKSKERKTT